MEVADVAVEIDNSLAVSEITRSTPCVDNAAPHVERSSLARQAGFRVVAIST